MIRNSFEVKSATNKSLFGSSASALALKRRLSPTVTRAREREASKRPVFGSRTNRTTPGDGSLFGSLGLDGLKKPLEQTMTNSRPEFELPVTTAAAERKPKSVRRLIVLEVSAK